AQRVHGRELFSAINCVRCHVPDWHLEAENRNDPDYTRRYVGDRRYFDLKVDTNPQSGRLEGKLARLDRGMGVPPMSEGVQNPHGPEAHATVFEPRRGAFTIRGVYSDFTHHDLGPAFHQMQFDGTIIKAFKTAPLWGVGSTAPYGHDGASLDLDD